MANGEWVHLETRVSWTVYRMERKRFVAPFSLSNTPTQSLHCNTAPHCTQQSVFDTRSLFSKQSPRLNAVHIHSYTWFKWIKHTKSGERKTGREIMERYGCIQTIDGTGLSFRWSCGNPGAAGRDWSCLIQIGYFTRRMLTWINEIDSPISEATHQRSGWQTSNRR